MTESPHLMIISMMQWVIKTTETRAGAEQPAVGNPFNLTPQKHNVWIINFNALQPIPIRPINLNTSVDWRLNKH